MKKKVVDIYTEKKKKDILKEGWVSFKLYDEDLTLDNIPYYIDKDKNVHVGIPCVAYEKVEKVQEDGSIKEIVIPTFSFKKEEDWESIKSDVKRFAIEEFEKEQLAEEETK